MCDGWAVMGQVGKQRQHAVTLLIDVQGVEWADFPCGAGNSGMANRRSSHSGRLRRSPSDLFMYDRHGLIEGRDVCEHFWCQQRYKDYVEHGEEFVARRAAEDARIAAAMPATRERLIKLERRLAKL